MRVLVACEFSGIVREAFRALGHDAWSCDLLPAEDGSPYHFQADAVKLAQAMVRPWDLVIAHPPCQFLCNSGVRWLGELPGRWNQMEAGARFFFDCLHNMNAIRVCVENPIMHKHAKKFIGTEQTQIIQPWQHGHGETKATCLWLKNLPLLTPTNIVEGRTPRVHHASPGPDRWKERSRTPKGIGQAMAVQWGALA